MVKFFGKFDQLLIYASFVQKIFIVIQSKFNQFGESLLLQKNGIVQCALMHLEQLEHFNEFRF